MKRIMCMGQITFHLHLASDLSEKAHVYSLYIPSVSSGFLTCLCMASQAYLC